MPRAPRVTAQKLIRALKKIGFVMHAERGTSHVVLSHADGRRVTVPRHPGDIRKGTLGGILRDLDMTPDDLRNIL